jgi:hypothetical protein
MLDIPTGELAERIARLTTGICSIAVLTNSGYEALDIAPQYCPA